MKLILIIIYVFFINSHLLAQGKYGHNWVMGRGNTYNYNFDNQQFAMYDTNYKFYFRPGSSCISDSFGTLKIVSQGFDILGNSGTPIENGDTIVPVEIYIKQCGRSNYSQSSIILPFTNGIYYVITPTASDFEVLNYWNVPNSGRALFDLLLYHKVDMKLNGGLGKVVKRAIPLLENVQLSKTQMMACRHANGVDWWLLKQAHDTNLIYKFLVTIDSIYTYQPQGFSEPHFTKLDIHGQSMFNPEGTKYATVCLGINQLFFADFDRCTAQLSNPTIINLANHQIQPLDTTSEASPRGLCFSPNGSFIYIVKGYNIFQYEWGEPDSASAWYHVANLDTTWDQFQKWGSSYLGPDNKIYIGNLGGVGKAMTTIDNPDVKGAGCGFCPKCFQFPKIGAGNPPCMPNYALGADLPCWPLGTDDAKRKEQDFVVYPNPADDLVSIQYNFSTEGARTFLMFDMLGREMQRMVLNSNSNFAKIKTNHLVPGLYTYSIISEGQKSYGGKITIAK